MNNIDQRPFNIISKMTLSRSHSPPLLEQDNIEQDKSFRKGDMGHENIAKECLHNKTLKLSSKVTSMRNM